MLRPTHWVAFASAMLVLLAPMRVATAAIISVGPYTPSTTIIRRAMNFVMRRSTL